MYVTKSILGIADHIASMRDDLWNKWIKWLKRLAVATSKFDIIFWIENLQSEWNNLTVKLKFFVASGCVISNWEIF